MPRRQRAELFVRGRVKENRWSDKKGRLTLQAAQVWEERDRRTDAAHRTTSFANASSKFKCRPFGTPPRLAIFAKESRFPAFAAKSATSHARSTWPATHPCHAATPGGAFSHVHGTKGMQAAFVTRPTLRSAECPTESSAAPPADDPSRRPRPGKATANAITATTSAPKPKRSNLHRSSRA